MKWWFPCKKSQRVENDFHKFEFKDDYLPFYKTSSNVNTSAYLLLCIELFARCSQIQLLFSCIKQDYYMILFSNSEFPSCCFLLCLLKKKKIFLKICHLLVMYRQVPFSSGWNDDSYKKWIIALSHTSNLGKMRYSCVVIFTPRISFSLWQIRNNYSLYSLFLLSTWFWIFLKIKI